MFGIDWEGPPAEDNNQDMVTIPDTPSPLLPNEFDLLRTLIHPLHPCDDLGISMYCATREFVRDVIAERQIG